MRQRGRGGATPDQLQWHVDVKERRIHVCLEAEKQRKKQFLFRPGELHVVFWALAALGKYVEGSGIDQAWVEL